MKCGPKLDKVTVCTPKKGGGFTTNCVTSGTVAGYLSSGGYLGTCVSPAITKSNAARLMEEPTKLIEDKLLVRAVPNPSPNYFMLYPQSLSNRSLTLVVTDVAGRVIETKNNVAANGKITLGQYYRPGVYIVTIIQGNERVTLKLIRD